jgi:CBS domain-containing protein
MKARDLMTSEVIAVRPETPTDHVAKLLFEHRIGACPVIDENGALTGMVSAWDLIFALLAEGEPGSEEFVARILRSKGTARDVMGGPIITVTEETDVAEIARILIQYRINRVPVVRDARLVGIVSRGDMLRALVQERVSAAVP